MLQRNRRSRRRKGTKIKYSKLIVALVIILNALFAAVALWVFSKVEKEPTALIAAWFGFTTGELWLLAGIKKHDQRDEQAKEENDND